jgi:hypothetical protein
MLRNEHTDPLACARSDAVPDAAQAGPLFAAAARERLAPVPTPKANRRAKRARPASVCTVRALTLWLASRGFPAVTLGDVAAYLGVSEPAASARLRDLRKARFGLRLVDRRADPGRRGVWLYRLVPEAEHLARLRAGACAAGPLFCAELGGTPPDD